MLQIDMFDVGLPQTSLQKAQYVGSIINEVCLSFLNFMFPLFPLFLGFFYQLFVLSENSQSQLLISFWGEQFSMATNIDNWPRSISHCSENMLLFNPHSIFHGQGLLVLSFDDEETKIKLLAQEFAQCFINVSLSPIFSIKSIFYY